MNTALLLLMEEIETAITYVGGNKRSLSTARNNDDRKNEKFVWKLKHQTRIKSQIKRFLGN